MIREYKSAPHLDARQMDTVARLLSSPAALSRALAARRQTGSWNTPNTFIDACVSAPQALRIAATSAMHLLRYAAKNQPESMKATIHEVRAWLADAAWSPAWIAYGPLVVAEVTQWPDSTLGKKNTMCVAHVAQFLAGVAYGG